MGTIKPSQKRLHWVFPIRSASDRYDFDFRDALAGLHHFGALPQCAVTHLNGVADAADANANPDCNRPGNRPSSRPWLTSEEFMEQRSLRSHILDLIGSFLYKEKFTKNPHLPEGILNLIDAASSYKEEGKDLYPEIFITDNIDAVLQTLPFCQKVEIASKPASVVEFSQALKLCAPLARNGWVIYINVSAEELKYGLVTSELSELSPTFRNQSVGELSQNEGGYAIAYLQNAGNKSVLLRGSETQVLICLSLNEPIAIVGAELSILCQAITQDIEKDYKTVCLSYFEKLLGEALISGHGNLIGVVKDDAEAITRLKERHRDGVYLNDPIDITQLVMQSEEQKTREASTSNRLHSALVQYMVNHDGVTIFPSKGRVLGYHFIVKPDGLEQDNVGGAARMRAFEILKRSEVFECCFFKSQDGNEKIWRAADGR